MNSRWGYILGGVLVLGAGAYAAFNMKRLAEELETVTKIMVFNVGLSGLQLRIEVTLKNPTSGSLKLKFPFVKLQFADKDKDGKDSFTTLAVSEVKNEDISLPGFGEIKLPPIMVSLDFITLATSAPAALSQYRQNGSISLVVKTVTTINNKIPYTKTEQIAVKA